MKSLKDQTFQDRLERAAEARQKALEKLKAKAPVDPAVVAAKLAAQQARDAAAAEKRDAKRRAIEDEKLAKLAAAEAIARAEEEARLAAEAEIAARPPKRPKTEEELKAARDARYAARKKRK